MVQFIPMPFFRLVMSGAAVTAATSRTTLSRCVGRCCCCCCCRRCQVFGCCRHVLETSAIDFALPMLFVGDLGVHPLEFCGVAVTLTVTLTLRVFFGRRWNSPFLSFAMFPAFAVFGFFVVGILVRSSRD